MCIVDADFSFFSRLHASISLLILQSTYISTKWSKSRENISMCGEINSELAGRVCISIWRHVRRPNNLMLV